MPRHKQRIKERMKTRKK